MCNQALLAVLLEILPIEGPWQHCSAATAASPADLSTQTQFVCACSFTVRVELGGMHGQACLVMRDEKRWFMILVAPHQAEFDPLFRAMSKSMHQNLVYLWCEVDPDKNLRIFLKDLPDASVSWSW